MRGAPGRSRRARDLALGACQAQGGRLPRPRRSSCATAMPTQPLPERRARRRHREIASSWMLTDKPHETVHHRKVEANGLSLPLPPARI